MESGRSSRGMGILLIRSDCRRLTGALPIDAGRRRQFGVASAPAKLPAAPSCGLCQVAQQSGLADARFTATGVF